MTTTEYGTQLSFSKTSTPQLTLHRPITNKSRTLMYIPITISDNEQQLSTNANHYTMVVRPTVKNINYKLKANYIIFGTTGDTAIRLESNKPMKPNTLMIILRNNDNLRNAGTNNADNNTEADTDQLTNTNAPIDLTALGQKNDITAFNVNPAAKNVTINNKIDNANTGDKLYHVIYSTDQINKVKKKIAKEQHHIKDDLKLANELTEQLTNDGYKVPTPPAYTKADWRPYNTVDPKTGDIKNGGNVLSTNTSAENNSNQNPDSTSFPTTLPNKQYGDNAMNNQAAQGNSQTTPLTLWQNLQSTWQDILTTKQDIYVTQNAKIFMINYATKQQNDAYSVQKAKHVHVIDTKLK